MTSLWSVQRVAVVLAAVALGAALSGCASTREARLTVPVSDAINLDADSAALQGVLEGEVSGDEACFWIDGPNGRAYLVLPEGYWANEQLELHDGATGLVVATAGEAVLVGGMAGEPADLAGCPSSGIPWFSDSLQPALPEYDNATLAPSTDQ